MNRGRTLLAIPLFLALSGPGLAHAALDKWTLEAFGGTYLADCATPTGARLVIEADELTVIAGAKRVTARSLEAAASWFGQDTPPEYRTAIISRVNDDPELLFTLYEDATGYYAKLDADAASLKGLDAALLSATFRKCPAAAPPAPAAPTAARPAPDSSGAAMAIRNDKAFHGAYVKALGPRMRERWLAVLDGPAPPIRTVRLADRDFTLVATCKAHDCAENNMVVLWSAPKKQLYGLVRLAGVNERLGAPPPELIPKIQRLWQETWRSDAPAAR